MNRAGGLGRVHRDGGGGRDENSRAGGSGVRDTSKRAGGLGRVHRDGGGGRDENSRAGGSGVRDTSNRAGGLGVRGEMNRAGGLGRVHCDGGGGCVEISCAAWVEHSGIPRAVAGPAAPFANAIAIHKRARSGPWIPKPVVRSAVSPSDPKPQEDGHGVGGLHPY
jgi:hypothetical protein